MATPFRIMRLRDITPPNRYWNEQLGPDEVAVFFSDCHSGRPMSSTGESIHIAEPPSCHVFNSVAEARDFCRLVVKDHRHIQCEGYDRRGKSVDPILTIMSQRRERAARAGIVWKIGVGILCLALSVPLLAWDYRHSGLLVIPTLFGINFILVAIRLFWWACAERKSK